MNFNNINYFLVIAEEGNISAAARKLYISQQSLSEHLKKMEDEVGTPLFKRDKSLILTPAGECFYDGCKELINMYNTTLSNIKEITATRRSKITIAIPTAYAPPYLLEFLIIFQEKHPEYEVVIVKRQHSDIAHNMSEVDLYVSLMPLSDELENHIILESDSYCVTFQKALALKIFGDKWESVEKDLILNKSLFLLKEMPFIVLMNRYKQVSQDLRDIFREYHFSPIIGFNSENCELNDQVCVSGLGCLIAPESYVKHRLFQNQNLNTSDLLSYPIEVKSFQTTMAISHVKGKRLHTAELDFIRESKTFLSSY